MERIDTPVSPRVAKIGLGTAQFGFAYGVSNRVGGAEGARQVGLAEVSDTLDYARRVGIRVIDTAPGYGESEQRLGDLLPPEAPFDIVTKTPVDLASDSRQSAADAVGAGLRASLKRLRRSSVYGLLEHRPDRLLGEQGPAIFQAMQKLRDQGLTSKLGASVYRAEQIDELLQRYPIDLIQLPVSVLDQRLIEGGQLERLRAAKVEIHARSALLQGVIAMRPDRLPVFLSGLRGPIEAFHEIASQWHLSAVDAAIGFAVGLEEVDVVVCGVETRGQLEQIVGSAGIHVRRDWFAGIAPSDPTLIDPSTWPKRA